MTTSLDSSEAEQAMEDVKPTKEELGVVEEAGNELDDETAATDADAAAGANPAVDCKQEEDDDNNNSNNNISTSNSNNNINTEADGAVATTASETKTTTTPISGSGDNNNISNDNNNSSNNYVNGTIEADESPGNGTIGACGVNRMMKIKKLRAKLVNEEHRLVLMKKIRQSQTRPIQQQQHQPGVANNLSTHGGGSSVNNNNFGGQLKKPSIRQSQLSSSSLTSSSALPLHQKNHQLLSGGSGNFNNSSNNSNNSLNQTPAHAHQRPKVNTLWNPPPPMQSRHPTPAGIAPPHVGNLSRQPITTPPNVVQAMMGSLTSPQSLLMNSIANAQTSSRRQQQSSISNKMQSSSQLLMQKRPSFKPSLQKQLEQTLLQQQQQQQQQLQQQSRDQQNKFAQGLNFVGGSSSNKRGLGGMTSPHVGNLSRQPITTPPNVVQDMRANLSSSSGQQSLLMNANNLSSSSSSPASNLARQSQSQQSPFNKSQATQLLIQRRNAAKTAIQKQLEQNLMQLPQKQIQLAIDFIPNANNIEFVYYIGLEACVDYLTDTKNPLDIEPLKKPLECSTCGTDFTPSWSWKRSNAVCENCVGNHVKKSIKNSQANRIKSALAKAVKQESEMDQRIMAEAASVVSSPSGSPATSSANQHSLLQQPTSQRSTPHRNSSNNSLANNSLSNNNWSRQQSPLTTSSSSSNNIRNSASNLQSAATGVPPNPLAGLQPAAILSLLQMNPQLNALASLINPTPQQPQPQQHQPVTTTPVQVQNPNAATTPLNNSTNGPNNANQFAQVAALLMNQLTTNLWRR